MPAAGRVEVSRGYGLVEATASVESAGNTQVEISPVPFPVRSITVVDGRLTTYIADCLLKLPLIP